MRRERPRLPPRHERIPVGGQRLPAGDVRRAQPVHRRLLRTHAPGRPAQSRPRAADPAADDLILEKDGAKVLVDAVSLPFLQNAVIDYSEELIGARFVIENPNASSSCGCGTSFSI